ncbi:fluoride efflux transporter CrcB [Streptomyces pathocidini]|uniref:fluoride efflux transporter CrcB n=1 Tax=Streptomyces pathocidini TaxID=1650571 RepID=UPI003F4D5348
MDPDVDLHVPADRAEAGPHRLRQVLAVVAAGGAIGAVARYGATLAWPTPQGAFPWAVFAVNVVGCALIGVLMVLVSERGAGHPLVRPFLGTGVLGGFTTFSTYAVDLVGLLERDAFVTAVAYAAGTLAAALAAVWGAAAVTRAVVVRA